MRRNILVADDDKVTQVLITNYLEQAGYVVNVCKDGFDALEELEKNSYDLLILDLSMPHMSGMKVLKTIRSSAKIKEMPVIVLTGSQDLKDVERAKNQVVSDYLIKPPSREVLLFRINLALGGSPQVEEIKFAVSNSSASGFCVLPVHLISISRNGFIIKSEFPLNINQKIEVSKLPIFNEIALERTFFEVKFCNPSAESGYYESYASFLGSSESDQIKINEWITKEYYAQR